MLDRFKPPPDSPAPSGEAPPAGADARRLMESVYAELRTLAADYLRRERAGHTLQPTALVHEAYLRLAKLERIDWKDRTHFCVAASGAIRRVLVDHARARAAAKRGGEAGARLTLSDAQPINDRSVVDVLALEEALQKLSRLAERKCRVVEMRFFGGLTIDETAGALGVAASTVEDDWAFARAWLRRELGGAGEP